jgi:BlaI family penicillinase repressor
MLSPNELEVMELLWSENRALTRTEIIELSPNKSWKPSTIHLLLNSLLKKEMIVVHGFKQTGKNYGRTFVAAITREEYTAKELSRHLPKLPESRKVNLTGVFAAMVNNIRLDKDQLDELQLILDENKRELDKG